MRIREIMSRDVRVAAPSDDIRTAAQLMAELDVGALPVGENGHLVGMLTDRDITIRAVAEGRNPAECRVGEIMSPVVKYVFDDEEDGDLCRDMSDLQIRRLPVLDREKRLVGIVSLADLATKQGPVPAEHAIRGVSRP
jgi:CBS domain-containing protein